jgi:hypothetical protein
MHTDRCGNTCRQKCCAKGSGKEVKIQEFMYRDTTNVEPEMYDYASKYDFSPILVFLSDAHCVLCELFVQSEEIIYITVTSFSDI